MLAVTSLDGSTLARAARLGAGPRAVDLAVHARHVPARAHAPDLLGDRPDRHGPPADPDSLERVPSAEIMAQVQEFVGRRFPGLKGAPIVGAEVCQYENTSNGDFLIDRHPALSNVWLVGGGSGHGFKHGPAVGEYVAARIADGKPVDPKFSLATKQKIQKRTVY